MNEAVFVAHPASLSQRMGGFERHLTPWVVPCIAVGAVARPFLSRRGAT